MTTRRIEVALAVRDGADVLSQCLAAIRAQNLTPIRIHVAVAPSRDESLRIALEESARDPRVVVHDNPAGDRGSGLNLALANLDASTEAVAMVDAHSLLEPGYLERAAAVLDSTGAALVGGPMRPVGTGVVGTAIAAALRSRVGVGNSSFHFDGDTRDVESVYLGVYRRSVLDAIGGYDPALLRTEDDDLNARVRASGGRIRLDSSIRSAYFGRQSLPTLFDQYRGYGFWKVAFAARRPRAIRLRHLIPAAFVGILVLAAVASVAWWFPLLPLAMGAYGAVLSVAAAIVPDLPLASRLVLPLAFGSMHFGYGIGTWHALLSGAWRR